MITFNVVNKLTGKVTSSGWINAEAAQMSADRHNAACLLDRNRYEVQPVESESDMIMEYIIADEVRRAITRRHTMREALICLRFYRGKGHRCQVIREDSWHNGDRQETVEVDCDTAVPDEGVAV